MVSERTRPVARLRCRIAAGVLINYFDRISISVAGIVLLAGIASFLFLLGRIQPLPEPTV